MTPPVPRLLLVDDDPRNLRILAGILAPLRYELRQAANGQEALDQVAAEPPDLILLDVMMPGMSGFEVCQRLKAQLETRFIPVVLVTALTERESKIAGLEAGADDFINKPVDAHELRARVKSLLRIKQLHDELAQRTGDLEEANANLRVEAALERVRAAVAAMRESQDLFRVVGAVKECLQGLGVRCEMVGINTIDEEAGLMVQQVQDAEGINKSRQVKLHLGVTAELYARWKAGQTWQRHWTDATHFWKGGDRWVVDAPFPHGTLAMNKSAPDPFSEEEIHLLERFTQVFSLAYTRFLDLQQAEERVRQLAIERALERVRAEVASMSKGDDIGKVMGLVFKEVQELGVKTDSAVVKVIDEEAQFIRQYAMIPHKYYALGVKGTPAIANVVEGVDLYRGDRAFREGEDWVVEIWKSQKGRLGRMDRSLSQEALLQLQEGLVKQFGFYPSLEVVPQSTVEAPFSHGTLLFNSSQPNVFTEGDLSIAEDFCRMISLGYARFLDFQRLEEGNTALSSANKELFAVNKELEQTLEEKEKAQEALVRSESMAAIGTLVAGVAHELNNPLGAAYSLVQTVQEMVEEDTAEQLQQEKEEIVGHLAFSRKELNRAKEIVAALLGLSRQNQDYTEAVELNTVVQDALRVLYNQYKKYEVNIAEEYEEGLAAVQGNFAQLGQVCMNLIKNAIEALKGGEGQIVLKTYREGEQVVFECADTGPGIPEEAKQRIFQPFFTTKAPGEGTGLGLYICHQTVEKHHGEIEVDSEVGKGTVFRVRLPARKD